MEINFERHQHNTDRIQNRAGFRAVDSCFRHYCGSSGRCRHNRRWAEKIPAHSVLSLNIELHHPPNHAISRVSRRKLILRCLAKKVHRMWSKPTREPWTKPCKMNSISDLQSKNVITNKGTLTAKDHKRLCPRTYDLKKTRLRYFAINYHLLLPAAV